jgi:alanine-synthesizing transaminase
VRPKAAFYLFPRIDAKRFHILDDEQFVLDFLRAKNVLLVHGGGFHWQKPDHFRLVYLPAAEVLQEAIGKLGEFLSGYRQEARCASGHGGKLLRLA